MKGAPMAKPREPVITVTTIFAGNQTDRQAFIDLIKQRRELSKMKSSVDVKSVINYITMGAVHKMWAALT